MSCGGWIHAGEEETDVTDDERQKAEALISRLETAVGANLSRATARTRG